MKNPVLFSRKRLTFLPFFFFCLAALLHSGCSTGREERTMTMEEIALPADSFALFPSLAVGADGRLILNWLYEPDTISHLMLSSFSEGKWTTPVEVSRGEGWFINWADFPSVISLREGHLLTYTLPKSGDAVYAYDIALWQSTDGGVHWAGPVIPHTDGTQTEHGFVSFVPVGEDRAGIIWLDGRNYAKEPASDHGSGMEADMTLRFATIDETGRLGDEQELDGRVCSCCQTDAAVIPGGAIVVYRDRSEEEIRDIAYVRLQDGHWTEPRLLHADNWFIAGCPVNGPAVDARASTVAAAWFTMANEKGRVWLTFSSDAGASFGEPIPVDDGNPMGRVDLKFIEDQRVVVSWVEQEEEQASVRLKCFSSEGQLIGEEIVADFYPSRDSGFPRMAFGRDGLFLTWTETVPGLAPRLRLLKGMPQQW